MNDDDSSQENAPKGSFLKLYDQCQQIKRRDEEDSDEDVHIDIVEDNNPLSIKRSN